MFHSERIGVESERSSWQELITPNHCINTDSKTSGA